MKKLTKILFVSGGALLLGAGSVLSYLQARPAEPLSDLTLANIEALARIIEEGDNIGGAARWWVWYTDGEGSHLCDPDGSSLCTF